MTHCYHCHSLVSTLDNSATLNFSSLDKGVLHKSVVFDGEVHIVEEIQLLKNSEPIKNLLLSSEVSDAEQCDNYRNGTRKCVFSYGRQRMCSVPVLF